jgi:hypothetical protein
MSVIAMERIKKLLIADQVKVFLTGFGMLQGNVRAAVHE